MSVEPNPAKPEAAGATPGPIEETPPVPYPVAGASGLPADPDLAPVDTPESNGNGAHGAGAAVVAREKVVAGAAEVRQKAAEAAQTLAPHVSVAADRTKATAEKAVGAVREKVAENPRLAAATEKTLGAKDRAVGTVREQVAQHPQVGAAAEKTLATSGKAARSAGQRARGNPKATGGVLAGGVLLLLLRRRRRRRAA